MRYTLLIPFLLLFFNCKTKKITEYKTIDESSPPTIEELGNKFYKYKRDESIYNFRLQKKIPLKFNIYTNVEPRSNNPNIPKQIDYIWRPFFIKDTEDSNDIKYFEDKLNKKYILYLVKDNQIITREYGEYFVHENGKWDSIKWANMEKKIFDSLNKNQIKYKVNYKYSKNFDKWIKINLIEKDYYVYITINSMWAMTNTYYQPKDTMFLINQYGKSLF